MKIKFKQTDEKEVVIVGVDDKGSERQIGQIFTPSGSAHDNKNAIQICGFSEAFDLWGCALYKKPKTKCKDNEFVRDSENNLVYEHAKDIQLLFDYETRPLTKEENMKGNFLDNCWSCFNDPCICEIRVKEENPYTVKREQDLNLLKEK